MPHISNADMINPQAGVPSTLLQWQNQEKGKQLSWILPVRVPTYDQERFERQILYIQTTVIGNGGVRTLTINPPADEVRSFRVNSIMIQNHGVANQRFIVRRRVPVTFGAVLEVVGNVVLPASEIAPLVLKTGTANLDNAGANQFLGNPFDCFRNKPRGNPNEFFDIVFSPNLPAASASIIECELELIPDTGSWHQPDSYGVVV